MTHMQDNRKLKPYLDTLSPEEKLLANLFLDNVIANIREINRALTGSDKISRTSSAVVTAALERDKIPEKEGGINLRHKILSAGEINNLINEISEDLETERRREAKLRHQERVLKRGLQSNALERQ